MYVASGKLVIYAFDNSPCLATYCQRMHVPSQITQSYTIQYLYNITEIIQFQWFQ